MHNYIFHLWTETSYIRKLHFLGLRQHLDWALFRIFPGIFRARFMCSRSISTQVSSNWKRPIYGEFTLVVFVWPLNAVAVQTYRAKCSLKCVLEGDSCLYSSVLLRFQAAVLRNYTLPHSTRVVLVSCGCHELVRYVSDFILWFKIVSSLCEAASMC